jgi:molybdenum cofactor cytidylyltransferase
MLSALVLAAGASTRMGQPKATLQLPGGHTFLSRVIATLVAGGLPRVVVVTGAHDMDRLPWSGRRRRVEIVENPDWPRGQLSSLVTGLDYLSSPDLEGVLVALVDVPLVSPNTVRRVADAWRRTRAPVVRPVMGARHGHPVVFDSAVFDELRASDPALGAKPVVRRHAAAIVNVEVEDPGAFRDVDTPEEYRRLAGQPWP